jgi:hypothetical protein
MTRAMDRESAFEDWLLEIDARHPDHDVTSTLCGCVVRDDDGEIVAEYDYEPDPYSEARVRY